MQQFKLLYSDNNYHNTFSNIQTCLRLNDWDEIGDGTHYLIFHMIGLYSFREWSLEKTIEFMWSFLNKLGIKPDYVTIHPDKISEWSYLYNKYDVLIKEDSECIWTDGNIGGYCTEFYKNDIEIGNIVNTLNTSIDVGFGMERLIQIVNNEIKSPSKLEMLEQTYHQLVKDNIVIGHKKQGFLLKKIITECILLGSEIKDEHFCFIKNNIIHNYNNYLRNVKKQKFKDKEPVFWLDSFGIDVLRLQDYNRLIE